MSDKWMNKLFFGDNLPILREHIPDKSVDLIYLDPPFNSKATYNLLLSLSATDMVVPHPQKVSRIKGFLLLKNFWLAKNWNILNLLNLPLKKLRGKSRKVA